MSAGLSRSEIEIVQFLCVQTVHVNGLIAFGIETKYILKATTQMATKLIKSSTRIWILVMNNSEY